MTRSPYRPLALTLLLAALVAAAPAALAERPQPELLSRGYAAQYLSRIAVETLLWQACPDDPEAYCVVVDPEEDGHPRLVASPAAQRRAVALLAEHDVPAGAPTLRVDLLTVERGGEDRLDGLTPSARRAVDALRGELGGSGYVLQDSGLIRTSNEGRTDLLVDRNVYRVLLDLRSGQRGDRFEIRHLSLQAENLHSPAGQIPAPAGSVLQAALDLGVGETAVVGTTRLDERRDLVMLLTARR